MTVVPFILGGTSATVVTSPGEYAAGSGRTGSRALIQNLDQTQLEDLRDSNASYDFRVGQSYKDHRYETVTGLEKEGTIPLLPGMAVVVESEEEVDFPVSLFGLIVPKVSLLRQGISNTTSKIDPGYRGRLYITIFNLGRKPVKLVRGQKICTLVMFYVGSGVRGYEKGSQSWSNNPATGLVRRSWSFLEANTGGLSAFLILLNIILILVTASQCS